MKDKIGNEIQIDDIVSYWRPSYHIMALGLVTRFTPKNVKIAPFGVKEDFNGHRTITTTRSGYDDTVNPENLIVVNEIAVNWQVVIKDES